MVICYKYVPQYLVRVEHFTVYRQLKVVNESQDFF